MLPSHLRELVRSLPFLQLDTDLKVVVGALPLLSIGWLDLALRIFANLPTSV